MIKLLFLVTSIFYLGEPDSTNIYNYTQQDVTFVKNVVSHEKQLPIHILKQSDSIVVLSFVDKTYFLEPNGEIGALWIFENNKWVYYDKD